MTTDVVDDVHQVIPPAVKVYGSSHWVNYMYRGWGRGRVKVMRRGYIDTRHIQQRSPKHLKIAMQLSQDFFVYISEL